MHTVAHSTTLRPLSVGWGARCAAAVAIVVGFWFVGHSLTHSKTLLAESAISADRIENHFAEQQAETTTSSAVGYFLLGGLGLWGLAQARGPLNWRHPLMLLCAAYVGWCSISMLWSIEPPQTFRKLAILGLMLAGAYGAASRFELEDLLWISVLSLACFVGVGLLAELALGTFRPWRSDYRFAGTCHPNDQGLQCALLALCAWFVTWNGVDRPWLRRLLISGALVGLALSKSRTTLIALVVAAAIGLILRSRGVQRWFVLTGFMTALCLAGIASSFVSVASLQDTADVAAMGRRENISSLTGRLPLWHELWKAAKDEPLVGHGYGAFWGEKNVLRYSEIFSWHIPHAHNGYLDMVLATGYVGVVLYVLWILATAAVAAMRYERTGRTTHLFVACLLLLALVHGVTESKFPGAGIGGFLLFLAIAATTIRPATSSSPAMQATNAATVGRRQGRGLRFYQPRLAYAAARRARRPR